jgi:hypothetical protein
MARYFATFKPLINYRQVVERGEWFRREAHYFGAQDIGCNFTARPVMNRRLALKRSITTALRYFKLRLFAQLRFRVSRVEE